MKSNLFPHWYIYTSTIFFLSVLILDDRTQNCFADTAFGTDIDIEHSRRSNIQLDIIRLQ